MNRITAALLLAFACSVAANAFDFDEHRYVTNVGARIAVQRCLTNASTCDKRLAEMLAELTGAPAIGANESFGDITGLGDYVKDASALFPSEGSLNIDDFDIQPAATNPTPGSAWPHMHSKKRDLWRFFEAAHGNENHFQQLALMTHLNLHAAAMGEANAGRLARAIVLEAYAEHFLEDFLSPGHIVTTRSEYSDSLAIAMHDNYNRIGIRVTISPAIEALADFVASGAVPLDDLAVGDAPLRLCAADFAAVSTIARSGTPLRLHGDSTLHAAENRTEAALLALVAAESLLDLVQTPATNHFTHFCWYLGMLGEQCEGVAVPHHRMLRMASMPYAAYDTEGLHLSQFWFRPWDLLLLNYRSAFPAHTDGVARGEYGIESLLFAPMPVHMLASGHGHLAGASAYFVPAVFYGAERTYGGGDVSNGAHVRLLFPLPHSDLQWYLSGGARSLRTESRSSLRNTFGGGLEAGFGFLFVRLGLDREYQRKGDGRLDSRILVTTGLTFVLPYSVDHAAVGVLRRHFSKQPAPLPNCNAAPQ